MKNAQHYKEKGARAYAIGIVRFTIAPPRGWQQAAERAGYQDARAKWKAENLGADEWEAALKRNRAFCQFATKG